jgi:hypothetical protein
MQTQLAQGKLVLPSLDFRTRAEEHSAALALQKACTKCEYVEPLLKALVSGLTTRNAGGHSKCPGGFARFVKDSPKLERRFSKTALANSAHAARQLCAAAGVQDDKAGTSFTLSFCMARFVSFLDPLKGMLLSLRTTMAVLALVAVDTKGF